MKKLGNDLFAIATGSGAGQAHDPKAAVQAHVRALQSLGAKLRS